MTLFGAPAAHAQYRAPRQYMQRLNPPPAQTQPAGTVAPVPPPVPGAKPADAAQVQAEKEAVAKRTAEFLKKRAEAGSANAQFELGKRYLTGEGVETNRTEARKWFEAAAKQEHEGAIARLKQLDKDMQSKETQSKTRPTPETPTAPATQKPAE